MFQTSYERTDVRGITFHANKEGDLCRLFIAGPPKEKQKLQIEKQGKGIRKRDSNKRRSRY